MKLDGVTVHHGNNLDILPTLPDNSVDSIVTDPPYELGFMGKKWDNSGIAYSVELWQQCLRVLKPGGHLLAFGGTRTFHRIAVAIEDAGFEIRDSIAWMYGSGFPKSLDISKAIDRSKGENRDRQLQFTAWMRSTGITAEQINEATQTSMASHYLTDKSQPAIATAELFDLLRPYLPEVPEEIERLVAERTGIEWTAYKNREVIGVQKNAMAGWSMDGETKFVDRDITAPSTPEAEKWQGWGTALKPAFEPIIVARKPLIGTVAENVLQYGTGGLNIDGSRIGTEKRTYTPRLTANQNLNDDGWSNIGKRVDSKEALGRWPANLILDEYTAELLDEQSGIRPGGNFPTQRGAGVATGFGQGKPTEGGARSMGDSGGASRFFYIAKASKRDRNEGLEQLPIRRPDSRSETGMGTFEGKGVQPQHNFHPTVKPTQLMRYLVKLVTPPGGTVLDPFTGSGSTGKAAILEGFDFIGIELTEEYLPIIEGRLKHAIKTRAEEEDKKEEMLF